MSKKRHKRNTSANHQIVTSNNTTKEQSVGQLTPEYFRKLSDKVRETSDSVISELSKHFQSEAFAKMLRSINTDVYSGVLDEWRDRFSGGISNDITEKTIVGALIIKECYSYSDKELLEKLKIDSHLRYLLNICGYFDYRTFKEAYISFGQIIFKHYKNTNCDIVSESLLPIAQNGIVKIRLSEKDVAIETSLILLHIIYKNIYRLMHNALDKCYKNKRVLVDYKIRTQVDEIISLSYDDVIFSSNSALLMSQLETIGSISFAVIRRLKSKQWNDSQLKNYFEKYYEVINGKVTLRKSSVVELSVRKKLGEIIGALQNRSIANRHNKEVAANYQKKTEYHSPDDVPSGNISLLMSELQKINERISAVEQRIDSINRNIANQFASLIPFEKQLSRLETLYKNVDGLDNRILLQEESLKSMMEKHLQISLNAEELSQTSKDVFELLKLLVMESIINRTK